MVTIAHRLFAVLLISTCASAHAYVDPPSRVARLGYLRGPVSFSPAGTDDWAVAGMNRPLVTGDRLWTEPGARDELQLGGAAVRMDGATLITVLTLDDRAVQLQLSQGTLDVSVRPRAFAGTLEVDTPNLALSIDRPGHYRVSVDPAGDTTIVRVDAGQAQVIGRSQAYLVNPGQAFRFSGPDLRNAQAIDPRYRDDFDRWAAERDRRFDRARAVRYVSPAMIGYDELDDYGSWRTVADYGPVWMPTRVARGWAPYRDGHWAWIAPWGWTWIDDAPWGFAVTHYGRWARFGDNWGWVPGPVREAPVYAPALVVFVSTAGHAARRWPREQPVAWFPLGPREAYRPAYQASPRYVAAINHGAIASNGGYINRQVEGAVTAVPARVFAGAHPVRAAAVALPRESIMQAPLIAAPLVRAGRESMASEWKGARRPAQDLLSRGAMTHLPPAIAAAHAHRPPPAPVAQAPVPALPVAGQGREGREHAYRAPETVTAPAPPLPQHVPPHLPPQAMQHAPPHLPPQAMPRELAHRSQQAAPHEAPHLPPQAMPHEQPHLPPQAIPHEQQHRPPQAMQHEPPPLPPQAMRHEAPHLPPQPMPHEAPHRPPQAAPHEAPHAAPPVMPHEPPHPPPQAAPHEPPHAPPPAAPPANADKPNGHGGEHGEGGRHKDEHH
jgi:hypothetical protein